MNYLIQLETRLERKLHRLQKRDRKTYDRVISKIIELSQNPYSVLISVDKAHPYTQCDRIYQEQGGKTESQGGG